MAKKASQTEKKSKSDFKEKLSSREVFDMTSLEREAYFSKFPEEKEIHFPSLSEDQLLSDMTSLERETYLSNSKKEVNQ